MEPHSGAGPGTTKRSQRPPAQAPVPGRNGGEPNTAKPQVGSFGEPASALPGGPAPGPGPGTPVVAGPGPGRNTRERNISKPQVGSFGETRAGRTWSSSGRVRAVAAGARGAGLREVPSSFMIGGSGRGVRGKGAARKSSRARSEGT